MVYNAEGFLLFALEQNANFGHVLISAFKNKNSLTKGFSTFCMYRNSAQLFWLIETSYIDTCYCAPDFMQRKLNEQN